MYLTVALPAALYTTFEEIVNVACGLQLAAYPICKYRKLFSSLFLLPVW